MKRKKRIKILKGLHIGKRLIKWSKKREYYIASYSGKDNTLEDYQPTCFIIFDKTGDYLKTIETGYRIDDFCYDKDNNRIIMVLNDNNQFAYFDLNYII